MFFVHFTAFSFLEMFIVSDTIHSFLTFVSLHDTKKKWEEEKCVDKISDGSSSWESGIWEQWDESPTAHSCDFYTIWCILLSVMEGKIKASEKRIFTHSCDGLALKESKFDMGSFNVYRTHFNSLVKRQW